MKIRHSKHLDQQSGLSTMELLISLALLALIAGGLASSLNLGLRLFDRSQNLAENSDALTTRARLRSFLASALPPTKEMSFPVSFSGNIKQLEFVSFAATPFAPEAAAIYVRITDFSGKLEAIFTTLDRDGNQLETFKQHLNQHQGSVKISYYAIDSADPGWQNAWSDSASIPDLVRIELAEGAEPAWPEFTVRLRLGPRDQ